MAKNMIRNINLTFGFFAVAVFSCLVFSGEASAYNGTGYFTGSSVCNRSEASSNPKDCWGTSMTYRDDVIWSRSSASSSPAMPPSSYSSKSGFISWLKTQIDSSDYKVRYGAYFIIATMLNDKDVNDSTKNTKLNTLNTILSQSRYSMATVNDRPQNYGAISFRGGRYSVSEPTLGVAGKEDFFFAPDYKPATSRDLILFRDSDGSIVYVLEIPCGNPIGGFPGLPGLIQSWKIDPESRLHFPGMPGSSVQWVDARTRPAQRVKIGQPVTFWHKIENSGGEAANRLATYIQDYTTPTAPPLSNPIDYDSPSTWSPVGIPLTARDYPPGSAQYYHPTDGELNSGSLFWTPTVADMGKWHCQRVATIQGGDNNNWRFSAPACVFVENQDFKLEPYITGSGGIVSPGDTLTVQGSVQNSGSTPGDAAAAGVIRVVLDKGSSLVPRTDRPFIATGSIVGSARWACEIADGFYGSAHIKNLGSNRCVVLGSVTNRNFSTGSTNIPSSPDPVLSSQVELGDRICYVAVVNKTVPGGSATDFKVSGAVCFTVSKSPLAQITGGDVIVRSTGAGILTGSKVVDGRRYGSWIEYGAFAPNDINTYTAGALKKGGVPTANPIGLTFANSGVLAPGNFSTALAIGQAPDLMSNFTSSHGWKTKTLGGSSVGNSGLPDSFTVYESSGTVTLQGMSNFNKSVVIKAKKIIVSGDVNYNNGPFSRLKDLPQLILRADEIVINDNVVNLDAWLLADRISTCGPVPVGNYYSGLNATVCHRPLTINGPIQTKRIYLRRTGGADGSTNNSLSQPAEHLNLRNDTYLWLQGQSSRPSSGSTSTYTIRTESIRELSPRY